MLQPKMYINRITYFMKLLNHNVIQLDDDLSVFRYCDGQSWSAFSKILDGVSRVRAKASPKTFNGPHSAIAMDTGELYVCCYYRPQILKVNPVGGATEIVGDHWVSGPATIRISLHGNLLVSEYRENVVKIFSAEGELLQSIGANDSAFGPRDSQCQVVFTKPVLDRPHMAIHLRDGSILVADTWNDVLVKFGLDGYLLPSNFSRQPSRPVSLDEGQGGQILVTCWGSGRVGLFYEDDFSDCSDLISGLNRPYDARFFRDGVIVADSLNGRILIIERIKECAPVVCPY